MKNCDFQAGAAADQAHGTRDNARSRKQTREAQDNFQTPICKQRITEKSKGATATAGRREQDEFARRHSNSTSRIYAKGSPPAKQNHTAPQRERSDTHNLRRGFTELKTNLRRSESASTRRIYAQVPPRARQIRTAPQRGRLDAHNLRRGFAELKPHSHGATASSAEGSPSSRALRSQNHGLEIEVR